MYSWEFGFNGNDCRALTVPDCLTRFTVAQSVCFDKARVYAEHTYDTKVFDDKAVRDVKQTLKNIRNHLHDELTLYAYEAHLSR